MKNSVGYAMRRSLRAFGWAAVCLTVIIFSGQANAASTYTPNDPYFPPICTGGIAADCQYYLYAIGAPEAWQFLLNLWNPQCSDEEDNDGDILVDYPGDQQCAGPNDDDENPGGVLLPVFGSPNFKVAAVDIDIDESHKDLFNQIINNTISGGLPHGTQVAGLIVAKHNNDYPSGSGNYLGIAGVAPGTKVVFFPKDDFRNWDTITSGQQDILLQAKIINVSRTWGTSSIGMNSAMKDAFTNGQLVVAAAGNVVCSQDWSVPPSATNYPAQYDAPSQCPATDCDALLTVGALSYDIGGTTYQNRIASNMTGATGGKCSNVQPWVDLYAPGEAIVTTNANFDGLTTVNGTSFAAPLVSGAAAVLWAANPVWVAKDVANCLKERGGQIDISAGSGQTHPLWGGTISETDRNSVFGTTARRLDLSSAVDHAPTNIALTENTVAENVPGAVVGRLSAIDYCTSSAISGNLSWPDGVQYSAVGTLSDGTTLLPLVVTGSTLRLDSGQRLNYINDQRVNLTVTATDPEGLSSSESFTINVDQKFCWPPHRGVPGEGGAPTINGEIEDDKGWTGAHRVTYENGTDLPNFAFQGLKRNDGKYLYLSFEVRNDQTEDNNEDLIVINFSGDANVDVTDDRRIFIKPLNGSGTFEVRKRNTDGTWASNNLQVDNMEVGVSSISGETPKEWYVEVKVPTSDNAVADDPDGGGVNWIDISDEFLFYFNVMRVDSSDPSNPTAVQFRWPRSAPIVSGYPTVQAEGYLFSSGEWGAGTKSNSAQCKGLSLAWSDIGTENPTASEIKYDGSNTFFADVRNDTEVGGSPIGVDDVSVRFRIANWGMPPLSFDYWGDIPAANPTCPPGDSNSVSNNPTCTDTVPAASDGMPGTKRFRLIWDNPGTAYQPPKDHQCILAEIDSQSNTNIVTKSVYRNMDFVSASKFERTAEISAKGYGPPPNGESHHEFDLHVTAEELPEMVDEKRTANLRDGGEVSKFRWVVNGYRRTGEFVDIGEKRFRIVDPIGSFGYIVSHEGRSVRKWQHELLGAEKVGENHYRLSIKPEEVAQVTTRIEPKEKINWLFWLVVLIAILLFLVWLIRRVTGGGSGP